MLGAGISWARDSPWWRARVGKPDFCAARPNFLLHAGTPGLISGVSVRPPALKVKEILKPQR